jgi:hypothetical protein
MDDLDDLKPRKGGRARRTANPLIGDEGYLPWLFAKLEAGLITEDEWHRADKAHRAAVVARRAT